MDSHLTGENSYGLKKSFKEVFKRYRRKNITLDLSNVYDIHRYESSDKDYRFQDKVKINQIYQNDMGLDWETTYGMLDAKEWSVFTFSLKPGLLYIKNPFKQLGQRYWIARCLKDFTKKPNHLNIDIHNIINEDDDWWEYCQREHDTYEGKYVLEKVRWATLGYHYNWDTKEYSESSRNEFPNDLRALCHDIGKVFGFDNFHAEAGIINMYHKDSSLNGHTDHSELNLDAPLFSFSFGQSAVFLIGGKTIDEEPIGLLLKSGDIVIMSKEARLCYHGVPRIVSCTEKMWNTQLDEEEKIVNSTILEKELLNNIRDEVFWKPFESYVSKSRINMNIRQVL